MSEMDNGPQLTDVAAIEAALVKLENAVAAGRTRSQCLRRWSEFIRLRDGHRCVDCHEINTLAAHHIARKTFFNVAQYETGNGITLCRECHKEPHCGFNRKPDLSLPVDAQGGEKLPLMERYYSILLDDAIGRTVLREDFYFISDKVLGSFKEMQGYDVTKVFPGSRLEQAYLIIAETECQVRNALASANGFEFGDEPMLPGGIAIFWDDDGGPGTRTNVKCYQPRSS